MDELLEQFLIEGRELVQAAGEDLLALERAPADRARLDGAFRAVHTLKGGAALFDLAPMSHALHAAEDLLGALRAGRRGGKARDFDALLACIGACEAWLDTIAATGTLPEDAAGRGVGLVAALRGTPSPEAGPEAQQSAVPGWAAALVAAHPAATAEAWRAGGSVTALRYAPAPDCFFLGDDPLALVRAVPDIVALTLSAPPAAPGALEDPFTCVTVIAALSTAAPDEVRAPFRFVADQVEVLAVPAETPARAAPQGGRPPAAAARSLRVDPADVDALLALAGELVVAKNGLGAGVGAGRAEFDRLVTSLYGAALRLRMVPLAQTFRRLPRIVRDAAAKLGRDVTFTVEGEGIELDKDTVDALYDPLLHALRNAVDHGIAPPEVRVAAGKPAGGRIVLRAHRDAEAVIVGVADDGAGIDPARLRRTAVARGLLDEAAAAALADADALDLVFAPGFSTAADVTAISGRGVGMDAVRASVVALGGRVTLSSVPGRGTEIRFVLPRSRSLATVLTVEAGGEVYGVPIESVGEILRVPRDAILPAGSGEAFVLRDRTVPLLDLGRLLGAAVPPGDGTRAGVVRVLLAMQGGAPVGLAVEAVGERLDVLLRPPGGLLAAVPGLLGTALRGDGGVLLVLDLPGLIG